jgi:WD40 repeat protein
MKLLVTFLLCAGMLLPVWGADAPAPTVAVDISLKATPPARRLPCELALITFTISPDSRMVAGLAWDKTIRLWDLATGKVVGHIPGIPADVNWISFSSDSRLLLGAHSGPAATPPAEPAKLAVLVWDVATGAELRRLDTQMPDASLLRASPAGPWLAVNRRPARGEMGATTLRVLNITDGTCVLALKAGEPLAFSPDGAQFFCSDQQGSVRRLPTGAVVAKGLLARTTHANMAAFLSDGAGVVISDPHHACRLYAAETGALLRSFDAFEAGVGENKPTSLAPDGRLLCLNGAKDGWLVVERETGKVTLRLTGLKGYPTWASARVLMAPERGGALLINAATGASLVRLSSTNARPTPDGTTMVGMLDGKMAECDLGVWPIPEVKE